MSLMAAGLLFYSIRAHALPVSAALSQALHGTQASAVVLDPQTGALLASAGQPRSGTPGSTIKPLLLAYALEHGIVQPETEVYCRRDLHIAGRALPCTHPDDHPLFTAQRALAESCNTWFAELGRRFSSIALETALQQLHLPHSALSSSNTAVSFGNIDQRQLAVLGLNGVSASPLQLARAYRQLLQRMPPNGVVATGLRDSVDFGMANPASVPGMSILGKTGTASDPGEAWTHGWFIGILPGRLVLVVYVPHGDGGTAAALGKKFFRAVAPEGHPK